jgi:hypothetical protein
MAPEPGSTAPPEQPQQLSLTRVQCFPGLRVLAWADDVLYASRGYTLLSTTMDGPTIDWQPVGQSRPPWWRNLTSTTRLGSRFVRDGFHALAILPGGDLVAAVPGAIVTLHRGESEFRVTHKIVRGTRPLHVAAAPGGRLFWGEYFDNAQREEVHVYVSGDRGGTWQVAYTFPKGAIRHVHNIVYDDWQDCLWVLTGDYGTECRILRASCDFKAVEVVTSGNQQARAVAAIPTREGLYFASDTPLEANHVFRLDREGNLAQLSALSSSSIHGCRVGDAVFFSTMVEPSEVNRDQKVRLYGGRAGGPWLPMLEWQKDFWPMGLFQYGNVFLPDGRNTTNYLAATTIAVRGGDGVSSILRVG